MDRISRRPGGDDYQNIWINPNDPNIILIASDQGAIVTVNGGETWSSWYNQPTAQMYHVSADNAFPYRVCGGQQESGSACVSQPRQRWRDHLARLASGGRRRIRLRRARSARSRHRLRRQGDALRPAHRAGAKRRRRSALRRRTTASSVPSRCCFRRSIRTCCTSPPTHYGPPATAGRLEADQPRPHAQDLGRSRQRRNLTQRRIGAAHATRRHLCGRAVVPRHQPHLGRHRRRTDLDHHATAARIGTTSRRRR